MLSKAEYEDALLKTHRLHVGVYRRVADKLGVDHSYVRRVATGKRKVSEIRRALLDELHKIQRLLKVKDLPFSQCTRAVQSCDSVFRCVFLLGHRHINVASEREKFPQL